MIRKEIRSASGVVLVFKIEGDEVEVHWRSAPGSSVWPGDPALFPANDFIELGQTLSSIEQGEAHDAVDELQGRLRELGNDILRVAEACPREHLDLSEHALEMLTNMNNPGGAK